MSMVVANRYARALADVVARSGDYRASLAELESFRTAFEESADLREVLESPAVPLPQKMSLVEALAGRLGLSPITVNFLRVLLAHYRMALVRQATQAFRRIANQRMGVALVKVFSAADLSPAEQQAIASRFTELTGKGIELEFHRDEQLLGGVRAQIESTVYDGTVRGELDRIRQQLITS